MLGLPKPCISIALLGFSPVDPRADAQSSRRALQGALVHFTENGAGNNITTATPWIAMSELSAPLHLFLVLTPAAAPLPC